MALIRLKVCIATWFSIEDLFARIGMSRTIRITHSELNASTIVSVITLFGSIRSDTRDLNSEMIVFACFTALVTELKSYLIQLRFEILKKDKLTHQRPSTTNHGERRPIP